MPNSKIRRYLATGIIYLALGASVFGFNVIRARTARITPSPIKPAPEQTPPVPLNKQYFSLTTNRSYSPNETARLWTSYQNIDYLDFRVYRIKDPARFFKQLEDPHEMGEKETAEIAQSVGASPSLLERTHGLKISLFGAFKDYIRTHLTREHRETFNQKFRKEPPAERTPLNVADYARVPLLNPSAMLVE